MLMAKSFATGITSKTGQFQPQGQKDPEFSDADPQLVNSENNLTNNIFFLKAKLVWQKLGYSGIFFTPLV